MHGRQPLVTCLAQRLLTYKPSDRRGALNRHHIFELLEAKHLLAGGDYKLDLIAESGSDITSIRKFLSINEKGEIAFVGETTTDPGSYSKNSGVFVDSSSTSPARRVSFSLNPNRDYGTTAVINDSLNGPNQVVAREQIPGSPGLFVLRKWSTVGSQNYTIAASAPYDDPGQFEAILTSGIDVNNKDQVVFVALDVPQFGTSTNKLRVRTSRDNQSSYIDIGDFATSTKLQPQISTGEGNINAEVVFRSPSNSSIFKTVPGGASYIRVAGGPEGFLSGTMGSAPGINDDGEAVSFYGATSAGAGVWLSVLRPNGSRTVTADRQLIQVAGLADELGAGAKITSFELDSRVAVGGRVRSEKADALSELTVTFLATDPTTATEALWSVTVQLRTIAAVLPATTGSYQVVAVSQPTRLARVGDVADLYVGESTVQRTITDLEIQHPTNDRGEVGFWASFTNGQTAAIRATPPAAKVLNVVTHGFGVPLQFPTPLGPIMVSFNSQPGITGPLYALGDKLEDVPSPHSELEGDVESYVTSWASSDGWVQAAASLLLGGYFNNQGFNTAAEAALSDASFYMQLASQLANGAATKAVRELIEGGWLATPQETQDGEQIIHLVGHSRGAAVNARVASLLSSKGYKVGQYTALDGYSTDWPGNAGLLGDISIVDELSAAGANVNRRVNYRVQDGLAFYIIPMVEEFLGKVKGFPTTFTPLISAAILAALPDARAPQRAGFENIHILSNTGTASNHVNISAADGIYTRSDDPAIAQAPYIWDNYVGQHRDQPAAGALSALDLNGTTPLSSNSMTVTVSPLAQVIPPTEGGFIDGDIEQLVSLQRQLEDTQFPDIEDPALAAWVDIVRQTYPRLAAMWRVSGDVALLDTGVNAALQLTQSADTSIGQPVMLPADVDKLSFDMSVTSGGLDDVLEVVFDDQVIASFPLTTPIANTTFEVPLTELASMDGEMRFRIVGPSDQPAVISLDNLVISRIDALPATVAGRHIFYNQSAWDGNSAAIDAASDNAAIAVDKTAYLPNATTATFNNITSFSRGINGIMVDLSAGVIHTGITASDFVFKVGNNNSPTTWATAPAPSVISVIPGGGTGGSDRVEITWASGAVRNTWLEVQVKANANTGLADLGGGIGDVHFWGNKTADSGTSTPATNFSTSSTDAAQVFATIGPGKPITDLRDYNRDGQVTSTDAAIVFANIGNLVRINVGAGGPFAPDAEPALADGGESVLVSALAAMSNSEREMRDVPQRPIHRLRDAALYSRRIDEYFRQLMAHDTQSFPIRVGRLHPNEEPLATDELLTEIISECYSARLGI